MSLTGMFSMSSSLVALFVFSGLPSGDMAFLSFDDLDLKNENNPLPCEVQFV